MEIRRPLIILVCLGCSLVSACEDADERSVRAEDPAETAIVPEKETFQRRARAQIDQLAATVDSLEAHERVSDSLVAAVEEKIHFLREEIAGVEDMTSVAYRDRHDELQERLYALEREIVVARLAAASTRRAFLQEARSHMKELERDITRFAKESTPEGRDPQTPHASTLGGIRESQEQITAAIERLAQGEVRFSTEIQRNLAEEIGELTAELRAARDLVEYPELNEQ